MAVCCPACSSLCLAADPNRNCRTSLHSRREAASRSKLLKRGMTKQQQQQQTQKQRQQQVEEDGTTSVCTDLPHDVTKAQLLPSCPPAAAGPGMVPCISSIIRSASTAETSITTPTPLHVNVAFSAAAAVAELADVYCTGE